MFNRSGAPSLSDIGSSVLQRTTTDKNQMSAVEGLKIVLQHDIDEQYQYQPGEIVRGNIEFKLSRPTAIRTINVKVYGEGNVSWQSDDNQGCQAQEVYVDAAKAILDTTNQEPLSLPRGDHEFPFDYILPDNIPSSFIGKYGNVTYTMRVMVTGVKSADTSISSEPFLVIRRSFLPAIALQPLKLATAKRLWASCTFGKLHASVSLEKQGGVPGEDLFLNAEIKNRSRRTVTAMQASLIMKSTFRAKNQSTDFRQVVGKKRDEFEVSYLEGRRWNYVRLTLPPYIPESKLEHCDIIELDYIFQFRVELSGGTDITLEAPIWIEAQPQGLEVPADQKAGLKINRQWTMKGTRHLGIDGEGEDGAPGLEYDEGWGVEVVPEMRSESTVVTNPLFKQNGALKKGTKVIPEEFFENTQL